MTGSDAGDPEAEYLHLLPCYSVRDDVASPEGLPSCLRLSLVDYDRQKAADMKKDFVQTKFESEIISKRAN